MFTTTSTKRLKQVNRSTKTFQQQISHWNTVRSTFFRFTISFVIYFRWPHCSLDAHWYLNLIMNGDDSFSISLLVFRMKDLCEGKHARVKIWWTGMHSSGMRTACSLPYGWGVSMTETPPDRDSPGQRPPWTETPLDRHPPGQRPPGQRQPPGQRPPRMETPHVDRQTWVNITFANFVCGR